MLYKVCGILCTILDTHAFAHYLHHKYFEVNYGDGTVPLDSWFGTWHDGTEQGDALMEARRAKRRSKRADELGNNSKEL